MKEKIAKLFKNKIFAVIITILAVALTAVYVYLLARPVAYGMAYSHTEEVTEDEFTVNTKMSLVFEADGSAVSIFDVSYKTDDPEIQAEIDAISEDELHGKYNSVYCIIDGKIVLYDGDFETKPTAEQIKAAQEEIKAEYDAATAEEKAEMSININAFNANLEEMNFSCTGSIIIAAVLGFAVLVLLGTAGTSLYFVIKKK